MERLTVFDGEFWMHKNFPPVEEDRVDEFIDCVKELADRLAAIEDILGDEYDLDLVQKLIQAYREGRYIILKEPEQTGVSRLRELAQADREGRCVLLPCKPSDVTVYQLRSKKHARGVGVSPRHISCATVWADGSYALHHQGQDDCLDRDFSKTWFLTREEAEAALRREQE